MHASAPLPCRNSGAPPRRNHGPDCSENVSAASFGAGAEAMRVSATKTRLGAALRPRNPKSCALRRRQALRAAVPRRARWPYCLSFGAEIRRGAAPKPRRSAPGARFGAALRRRNHARFGAAKGGEIRRAAAPKSGALRRQDHVALCGAERRSASGHPCGHPCGGLPVTWPSWITPMAAIAMGMAMFMPITIAMVPMDPCAHGPTSFGASLLLSSS